MLFFTLYLYDMTTKVYLVTSIKTLNKIHVKSIQYTRNMVPEFFINSYKLFYKAHLLSILYVPGMVLNIL